MKRYLVRYLLLAGVSSYALALGACESSRNSAEQCYPTTVNLAVCDPGTTTFSLTSTNPYYPLIVGNTTILEGTEENVRIRVERRVLNDTQLVAGVLTRVLETKEFHNDVLFEMARNFFAEAADGTVCYFGEDVTFYANGQVANTNGSWRAGVADAKPGIIMPAQPAVGQAYFQEQAPGVAIDMGRIVGTDGRMTLDGVVRTNVVTVRDTNPLEDCADEEEKLYVPGIGEAADTVKRLVSFTPGAR